MAKEKTVPELEKELAAALKQLEDSEKAFAEVKTELVAALKQLEYSGKALVGVQAENEKLEKSLEELSAKYAKELITEKEAYSALELVLQEERELTESFAKDGAPIGEAVSEVEIVLLKNGIARHVYSEAEAKRWEEKGYTQKED